ncbi:MAG: hypothetical protein JOZ29_16300 [Deltaproteobacteria bacterium]|nr:hypothetical protein [Deltaproteobacteria bacterium]MBV8453812.1 hypothetical protein [Deltaproteobacteria bacterium]
MAAQFSTVLKTAIATQLAMAVVVAAVTAVAGFGLCKTANMASEQIQNNHYTPGFL